MRLSGNFGDPKDEAEASWYAGRLIILRLSSLSAPALLPHVVCREEKEVSEVIIGGVRGG
jgi:hypothetical protein